MNHEDAFEARRHEIAKYLEDRRINPDGFFAGVRKYFKLSKVHYRRLQIRDCIARHLDPRLDMGNPKDRKFVWKEIAKHIDVHASTGSRWSNGITDPPMEQIGDYLEFTEFPMELIPKLDRVACTRFGISRTITYIRLFPWNRNPSGIDIPDLLSRCWRLIRKSKYFKRFADLNQYIIDEISILFNCECLFEGDLGLLKDSMDKFRIGDLKHWVWPYVIFRYATYARYGLTNSGPNHDKWLWDKKNPYYFEIWR